MIATSVLMEAPAVDGVVDKLTGDTRCNISVVPVKIWKIEDELFSEIVSPTRNTINRLDYLLLLPPTHLPKP